MDKISYLEKYLSKDRLEEGKELLKKNIPVQYIIGDVNFYGNKIIVNKNVLIPRFETELLVEKTIKRIRKMFDHQKINILDLGTGSGCIAITLKKEINSNVDAVDISIDALNVAKENSKLNNVNINFIYSNMLDKVTKEYDVIISNPPYISENEEIEDIVKNNEPNIALYAKDEGLYYYEEILKNVKVNLKNKFLIAFEIGYQQGNKIIDIANKYLKDVDISLEKDLSLKDRYIFISSKE